jgi:hypothetical protein
MEAKYFSVSSINFYHSKSSNIQEDNSYFYSTVVAFYITLNFINESVLFGKPRCRWMDNINIDRKEI